MPLETTKMVPGAKLDLTKAAGEAGLTEVTIGLGWDVNPSAGGAAFDADATVVLTEADEKTDQKNVVYFGQLTSGDGSTVHTGDNLTGEGAGDDEQIHIDLTKVDPALTKAIIYVSIYQAIERGQTFGMLANAFVRILNKTTGEELCRMDLEFDADMATQLRFGSLIKRGDAWFFSAEKIAVDGGIQGIVDTHVK
jgi:tellurium resistance protein TerD